jgi:putative membrane protein
MIALLASNSDWDHHGWFWLWPLVPLLWLLFFFLVLRLFFWRGRRSPWTSRAAPDARAILAERYARGEISHEEYRERLGHLEER